MSIVTASGAESQVFLLSTRNHFDGLGNLATHDRSYDQFDFRNLGCPQEVVVYVHGVWTSKDKATEEQKSMLDNAPEIFNRASASLGSLGYTFPIIGFSWDSDTEISSGGWEHAKKIARDNGPKLAQFLIDLENICKQQAPDKEIKIRLIGHSLGSRVILSSLDGLANSNQLQYKIASVNLMGAAVDNDEVSKNPNDVLIADNDNIKSAYGKDIEKTVLKFYNLVNTEDDALEPGNYIYNWFAENIYYFNYNFLENQPVYYPYFEQHLALGQNGIQSDIFERDIPQNYIDIIGIEQEIPNLPNANGDTRCDLINPVNNECTITKNGDNHLGYAGFIDGSGIFRNNGAMDVLFNSWRNNNP